MAAKFEKREGKRGVSWWVVIDHGGRKKRKSYKGDKAKAQAAVDAVNRRLRDGSLGILPKARGPTLKAFSKVFLAEDTEGLAPRTRRDLEGYLRKDGPLAPLLDKRLG